MKTRIYGFLSVVLFFACSETKNKSDTRDYAVKAFSVFNFYPGYDLNSLNAWTYLFKNDTIILMQTDSLYHREFFLSRLSEHQKDSLSRLLTDLDIKRLERSKSLVPDTNNPMAYCGPAYGFINQRNEAYAYIPARDAQFSSQQTKAVSAFLFSLKGEHTHDTMDLINVSVSIAARYIQAAPPLPAPLKEEIKFVPPIIREDQVEK